MVTELKEEHEAMISGLYDAIFFINDKCSLHTDTSRMGIMTALSVIYMDKVPLFSIMTMQNLEDQIHTYVEPLIDQPE